MSFGNLSDIHLGLVCYLYALLTMDVNMLALLELLIFFAVLITCAFIGVSLNVWLPMMVTMLLIVSFLHVPLIVMIPLWILAAAAVVLLCWSNFRRHYFSLPLLKYLRKHLPAISKTEQDALEAGDVWFEGEFFRGCPNWEAILAYKVPLLSQEEQDFIDHQVEKLCELCHDWEIVHDRKELSPEAWDYIKKEGFLGLVIPKKYGGKGFSALAHSTIITKLASRSASLAVSVMVPNSLGPGEMVLEYGTEQQKNYYLPRLARGEEIPCFGLTAPDAGSDAANISDRGVVCKQQINGEEKIGIRLSWDKRYITLAPIATLLGIAFKLYDPEHLLSEKEDIGITLALIPAKTPGVEIGPRHYPMNLGFMNGPTRGQDVFIPLDWVIGGAERMGTGWRMLMESLSVGRSISIPALSTACMKLAVRGTSAYARARYQFRVPIGEFEGIQLVLGRMGGYTYMVEAARLLTANAVSHNIRPSLVSAILKYHASELARVVVNDAMDIHGGRGIQLGPSNYLGLLYQALPISITVEGANILTRNLIIFGQGAIRCHPYIRQEIALATHPEPEKQVVKFDELLLAHWAYVTKNFARTWVYGLTAGYFISVPKCGRISRYMRQLTRMSTALAFVADFTMVILGGELKRKEAISARLGDVLSYLYLGAAVVKQCQDHHGQLQELVFVEWSLQYCLYKIQEAFDQLFNNFPQRCLGGMLKFLVFPWGLRFKLPRDRLSFRVARLLSEPSPLRERLCRYTFLGKSPADPLAKVEHAFLTTVLAEPIEKKINAAIKQKQIPRCDRWEDLLVVLQKEQLLSEEEIEIWHQAQLARAAAVAVDEF